jgi:hemoglobin
MTLKHLFAIAALVFTFGAHAQSADDSMYREFGGQNGIAKLVDDFLGVWQEDARINGVLKDADVERLGFLLKQQFTQLTGGPAVYSGRDMKKAHEDLGLRNADFNAVAEDLQKAMDKNNVPVRTQNKLLAKLAPMQHQIVTK